MRAYSLDLRRHVVQAIQAGTGKAHAAEVFGISVRTINRYLKRLADTDMLAAKPIPDRRARFRRSTTPTWRLSSAHMTMRRWPNSAPCGPKATACRSVQPR